MKHYYRLHLLVTAVFISLISPYTCNAYNAQMTSNLQTVGTMRELVKTSGTPEETIHLLGYHRVGDTGGGLFHWVTDSVVDDNGGTVIAATGVNIGRWIRVSDDVKVTYFGTRGDGIADDTVAIQAAIDSVSSTASPGVVFDKDRKVGGTIYFPAGKYLISDSLLVGPSTTLEGVGSVGGFQRRDMVINDNGAIIIAKFEDPKKWMISTAIYHRVGDLYGQLVGYREHLYGKAYDKGKFSRSNGVRIQNLLLLGKKNKDGDPPYGGIRLQACPGSVLQGIGVFGVDVAYMLNCGWGLAVRDCSSGSYLYGLLVLYDANGVHIDNCYINLSSSDRVIDETNMAPGSGGTNLKQRGLKSYRHKKTGILLHWANNVVLNNVITEHWDVARYYIRGEISDTGSWIEGVKELGYALVTVKLDLRTPHFYCPKMISEGKFLHAAANVSATISGSKAFPITYGTYNGKSSNRISVMTPDPDRAGWKYYPSSVSYVSRIKGHLRVAGNEDQAVDNMRLADTVSYIELDTALSRIAASSRQNWTITIKDGAICTLSHDVYLQNKIITFIQEGSGDHPMIRILPDADGHAGRLYAVNGGYYTFNGINIAVHNPQKKLNSSHRGLIAIEGGEFKLSMSNSSLSLVDTANAPRLEFSLLQNVKSGSVIEAIFSKVTIHNGYSIFEDGENTSSVISCRAVETIAPDTLLRRGVNGWGGENTTVLHSNIQKTPQR